MFLILPHSMLVSEPPRPYIYIRTSIPGSLLEIEYGITLDSDEYTQHLPYVGSLTQYSRHHIQYRYLFLSPVIPRYFARLLQPCRYPHQIPNSRRRKYVHIYICCTHLRTKTHRLIQKQQSSHNTPPHSLLNLDLLLQVMQVPQEGLPRTEGAGISLEWKGLTMQKVEAGGD